MTCPHHQIYFFISTSNPLLIYDEHLIFRHQGQPKSFVTLTSFNGDSFAYLQEYNNIIYILFIRSIDLCLFRIFLLILLFR